MNVPDVMKAIVLDQYNPNLIRALGNMKVETVAVPKPEVGQILLKVEASPVNPSDIAFLRGGYNIIKPLPAIPGFEGAGVIVAVGNGMDKSLIGQRVSFFSQEDKNGAWAEYSVVGKNDFIPVSRDLPPEQAACFFVNPFTAYALFEHVLENQHKALVQTAANGQVGQFIRYFAREHGVKVINLVRKPQHVQQLKSGGCKYVLDVNEGDFDKRLGEMCGALNVTAAIDAVGGELTGQILNALPAGSELVVFGGLSGMPVAGIDPLELIFKNKVLSGFNLSDWLSEINAEAFQKISGYLQTLFVEKKLNTRIHKLYDMDDFYRGLRTYISDMSAGKVVLKC
jgi:NADPH:quinone reductase